MSTKIFPLQPRAMPEERKTEWVDRCLNRLKALFNRQAAMQNPVHSTGPAEHIRRRRMDACRLGLD